MSLRIEIETKLQGALKERNKLKISTLRLILAAVKDREIASRTPDNRTGIKDEDIKQLLKKMIKQRNESIEIYKKNNRIDLLEIEKGEVKIISAFLRSMARSSANSILARISSGPSESANKSAKWGCSKKSRRTT